MLIDFSFSNFKCYRDPQQFTMTLSHSDHDDEYGSSEWGYPSVSPIAAVYGGNAAGKSALLDALTFITSMLRGGMDLGRPNRGTGRSPFLLDATSSQSPSEFLYEFVASDGNRYRYEVSVDDERVLFESLRVYTTGNHTARLFERELADGVDRVTYGRPFTGAKRGLTNQLRGDRLFLGVAGTSGAEVVGPALGFFLGFGYFRASDFRVELAAVASDLRDAPLRAQALSLLLGGSGLGIAGLKLDQRLRDTIAKVLASPESDDARVYRNIIRGISYYTMPRLSEEKRERDVDEVADLLSSQTIGSLLFLHDGADGSQAYLDEHEESDGTLAALAFLSLALDRLSSSCVTVIDEVDTSLHPTYVEQLVSLFASPTTNPHQSQLVFTTHDSSLITRAGADVRPVTRDQVWIAEKDREGASELLPVTAFGVREQENIGRNYLHGVYGDLPAPHLSASFMQALELLHASEEAGHGTR